MPSPSTRQHKGPVRLALAKTLRAMEPEPVDSALVRLAEKYADRIDQAADDEKVLADLGPKYLAVLTAMNVTPASRNAGSKQVTVTMNPLEALRAKRD